MIKKLKSKKGFSKEQISETIMVFIVVILILTIVVPIFDNEGKITKSIRKNEIEIQQKFSVTD